jgi:starvation-inducible DNA-binding protein
MITETLNRLQADYQVLYQKLRNTHWTVRGPQFFELHAKFEELYQNAAERGDAIAERTLAVGGRPLATLRAQLEASRLKEEREDSGRRDASQMVASVLADYEQLNGALREASSEAEEARDSATFNLLQEIADEQEKTIWMLRAYTGK